MGNKGNVDELLNTLRIPAFPPDRSQWRKLEIAVNFINKSKHCAEQTRARKESLKIDPKEPELLETDSTKKLIKPKTQVTSKMEKKEYENLDIIPKNADGSNRRLQIKDSKWAKIRGSLHQIM